jgi:hypothetical protein
MRTGDLSQGELLIEMGDALTDLREHNAILQGEVDSLREAVVRQDSLLVQLARLNGLSLPPR